MYDIINLGQVFTPQFIVAEMLSLRKNFGNVLEPSAGNGAFSKNIQNCASIEIDQKHIGENTLNMDFFDYPTTNKFDTIISNPPYVRYQDILPSTRGKLKSRLFDARTNLYLFFIEKCIKHLNDRGELIFITPRDFLKATSAIKLNNFIYENGTITDIIDLGDKKIFNGFSPNCAIWRFEKDNFSRKTNITKEFVFCNGQLLFTDSHYPLHFKDIFFVKVGAVSGADKIFTNETYGNMEFVCSSTYKTGETRKMIFNSKSQFLEQYKDCLINRQIKSFDETNWWQWGRNHYISDRKRIYVNAKTRNKKPFFTHACVNYDGSILAIFPHDEEADISELCDMLNDVRWFELGFVCDGRCIFSQKSLENSLLPDRFRKFTPKTS
ncbi:MAG: class I SAM-dependent methyltransferase [Helicobacteraceae bacterium]|jgi:adenine-specific DNA-methyltransferase|nr:class I SAM-dependent methyltransferase [Helicobacteraceae bacterium]